MASKYNAEGYYSPTEYEAFTRVEKEERAAKRAADFRPIVYICSPYSGNVNHNIEMARKYSRFAVDRHYLPIAPHLLFTQFMDDTVPEERETAIFMNFVLMLAPNHLPKARARIYAAPMMTTDMLLNTFSSSSAPLSTKNRM